MLFELVKSEIDTIRELFLKFFNRINQINELVV